MKSIIITPILIACMTVLFASCDLLGLKYQVSEPFDDTKVVQYVDMTAWEFISSRPDIFKSLKEAIEYAGMEADYSETGRTFMLLTDKALTDDLYLPTPTNTKGGSYFGYNKVPNQFYDPEDPTQGPEMIVPSSWSAYPKEQVVSFLKYHILREPVSINESFDYKFFFKTLAYENVGDTTLLCTEWVRDRNTTFKFNHYKGHRITNLTPRTSNIRCKSGVMHVFNDFMEAPTKAILKQYGVEY